MHEPVQVYDWQEYSEELLGVLGDVVEQSGTPVWLRFIENPLTESGMTVEMSREPGLLIGWTAPPECAAVGMVATGHTRPLSEGVESLSLWHAGAQIRMCCVVGRSGEVGWMLEGADGQTWAEAPSEGKMLDALKRCLGLSTTPPEVPAAEIHAAAWLSSVLEQAIKSPNRLTWSDVARLHPLARLLKGDLVTSYQGDRSNAGDLDDLVRIAANAWSWREIRAQACDGNLNALIAPELAAWMDEGMFSRWLMDLVPQVDQLVGALAGYLTPSAAERLRSVLP